MTNATSLSPVLEEYCASSGQLMSVGKSSIFFSPNVNVHVRADMCAELNIMTEAVSDMYLGLLTMVGLDRSDSFTNLVERMVNRLKGWKEKNLVHGWQGDPTEGSYTIHPCICNGCFQNPPQKYAKRSPMPWQRFGGVTLRKRRKCIG